MSVLFWVWLGGAFAVAFRTISNEQRRQISAALRTSRQYPLLSVVALVLGIVAGIVLWPLLPLSSLLEDKFLPVLNRHWGVEPLPLRCDGCGFAEPGELVLGHWVRLPFGWLATPEGHLACGVGCAHHQEQVYTLESPEVRKVLEKRCLYTVQPGDDLSELLRVSETTLREVEDLNGGNVEWVVGKRVALPQKTCLYLEGQPLLGKKSP